MAWALRHFYLKQDSDSIGWPDNLSYYLIDVDANKPTAGYFIGDLVFCKDTQKLYKATGPTTLVELTSGGGGSGEANTASNVGSSGVGVFDNKSGVDLRFDKLNPLSSKVSIIKDITNQKIDFNVPDASTSQKGAVQLATDGQSAANIAPQANDSRLSDARTPLSHTHPESDVTSLVSDLALKEVAANKNAANGYAGLSAGSKLNGTQQLYGSGANTACEGNDVRLSDARTPLAHAASHKSGGSDAIKLDEFAAPTDITTLNASTSQHGLLPKLPGGTTTFLRADGTFTTPTLADIANIILTGATSTILTATCRHIVKRFSIQGTGRLVAQGTASLGIR